VTFFFGWFCLDKSARSGETPGSVEAPVKPQVCFVERIEADDDEVARIDTARLIMRVQAGDTTAFNLIYERHFDQVYAYLRVALRDTHAAEDGVQEVFLRALKAIPAFELRTAPFSSWLMRVARNYTINHHRREIHSQTEDPTDVEQRLETNGDEHFDPGLLNRLSDGDLMVFIQRLPEAQRQVIALRYIMDMSTAETARILGRSPESVRQLQSRAFRFLRKRFIALGRTPARGQRRTPMRPLQRKAAVVRMRRFALMR
jgi:RNA polymerase sigma-70 factor (ECF subfamily)